MNLDKVDHSRQITIKKHAIAVFSFVFIIGAAYYLLAYLGIQLGTENPYDETINNLIITNKHTSYINPLYIIIFQFILDWSGMIALLASAFSLTVIYIITDSKRIVPMAIALIAIAMVNILHFFSVQHIIFTKIPYTWSVLTWLEKRIFIVTCLAFGPFLNLIFDFFKTKSLILINVVSITSFFLLSALFIYVSVSLDFDSIDDYTIIHPFSWKFFLPIVISVATSLLLYREYKKNPTYLTGFLTLAMIPLVGGEIYTVCFPSLHFYTSLNFVNLLTFIAFMLPFLGVVLDSRILFYELEYSKNLAQKKLDERNTFVAKLSERFQFPLKTIVGHAQSLQKELEGPINEKQKFSLSSILNSSDKLNTLTTEIIEISSVTSGDVLILPEKTNLTHVLQNCVESFINKASDKKLTLTFEGVNHDVFAVVDPMRIRQIVHELLNNAITFTDAGDVKLILEEQQDCLYIKVSDTGPGIPKNSFEKIFESYVQIGNSNMFSGVGLGLPILRKIVSAMRCEIFVDSEVDKGSTFTVKLPKQVEVSQRSEEARPNE